MQIDYKILWLDDNIKSFEDDEYMDDLTNFLNERGFNAIIDTANNEKEFFEKLNKSYDLILTDFHLAEGDRSGRDIVKQIRTESKIFSEILFYTAKGNLKDPHMLDRISFFQSNGSNHYAEVIEKIKELISLTIQKFNDIVVMRGMIMNETSEMDNYKKEIIEKYIKSCTENDTAGIKKDILELASKHFSDKLDKIDKWKKAPSGFTSLIKDNFIFSADYKVRTLGFISNNLSLEDFSNSYKEEIINMRNKFAHAKLETDEKTGRKFFKYKQEGITFDDKLCETIRNNIIKHKKNLENIDNEIEK